MLNAPTDQPPNGTILALVGEFDVGQRERLREAFERVVDQQVIVLDLSRTMYIDSTVLGSLLRLRGKVLERGGALIIAGATPNVRRLLEMTRLAGLFDIRDSLVEVQNAEVLRRADIVAVRS